MTLLQKLTNDNIDPFYQEWMGLQKPIEQMHRSRDREVGILMKKGIVLYKQLLAHCQDPSWEQELEPINGKERLEFIEMKPGMFASYRQLQELFAEMKKIIAGTRAKMKNHSNQ